MDFLNNNFEPATYFAPPTSPQYSAVSTDSTSDYQPIVAKKVSQKKEPIGFTDILSIQKSKLVTQSEFLVYGDKKNGLANDIATVLAKIVAEQTGDYGIKTRPHIAALNPKNHFLETIELEVSFS